MRNVAASLAIVACFATSATAGSLAEPVVTPDIVITDTEQSSSSALAVMAIMLVAMLIAVQD